ncbi:MAG: hypothetical protein WC263_02210, partial [Candidatus Micrarchaeia archaeon]
IYKNGALVGTTNYTATLAAGTYNFTANSTGNENYSSARTTLFATITKASAAANISLSWAAGQNGTVNCTIDNSQSNISLYQDGAYLNSSIGPSFATTIYSLTAGAHTFSCNASESENYTAASPVNLTSTLAVPTVAIQLPLANSVLTSNTSPLNFTASATGFALDSGTCEYSLNGTLVSIPSCENLTDLNLTDGVKTLSLYINDTSGNQGHATISFLVKTTGANNTAILNASMAISENMTIYVTNSSPAANITMGPNATNVRLNMTDYSNSAFSVALPAITVNASTSLGNVIMGIPNGTVVSGPTNWNGTLQLPAVKANSAATPTAVSGYTNTVTAVVEIGVADYAVNFSKAVRLLIPGKAGHLVGFQRGSTFTRITADCAADSQAWADANISAGSECKMNNGTGMVIWTKHFTAFATYTQAADQGGGTGGNTGGSSSGGGSVGGSSSASSIKQSSTINVDAGLGVTCPVTITREMASATNLSVLTTTLENTGGSECSMANFVFADTIPSDFPALNEVTFNPQYATREGWTVSFAFPTFEAGESKTLTYSAKQWIRTSLARNFTSFAMSVKRQESAPAGEPAITQPPVPEDVSPSVPAQPSSPPAKQPDAPAAPKTIIRGDAGGDNLVPFVLGAVAVALLGALAAYYFTRNSGKPPSSGQPGAGAEASRPAQAQPKSAALPSRLQKRAITPPSLPKR